MSSISKASKRGVTNPFARLGKHASPLRSRTIFGQSGDVTQGISFQSGEKRTTGVTHVEIDLHSTVRSGPLPSETNNVEEEDDGECKPRHCDMCFRNEVVSEITPEQHQKRPRTHGRNPRQSRP